MSSRIRFFILGICIALGWNTGLSQDAVEDEVFKEAKEAFNNADKMHTRVLSPKHYAEAKKHFIKAQDRFDKGQKLEGIRKDLSRAMEELKLATDTAELSQVALKDVLAMRLEVMASGLSFDRSSDFEKAEKKLREAAEKVEKKNVKGAQGTGREAMKSYRKAVVETLEKGNLAEAHKKLKDAKKGMTQKHFKEAQKSLKALEQYVKKEGKGDFSVADLTSKVLEGIDQAIPATT